ncbi:Phosphoglycerate mutase [Evansella cellulosilytica DSM 2522]|uniref:Phosphoglycerate mutase n=1 Tax=Evansella cellulosilytica (strain ATCC 21833 / DSM 2522 / FERM P-1141 / JCM 9156 / N-4) TaxID=649639 RepID=E6U0N7_EVAC2|nr:Phosphoglycerate mutase [Evansella cellulosilytica DSM 2522]
MIRHGQSEGNLHKIVQGHANFPLSNLGKKQALLVGEAFANVNLDALYSSDLDRAIKTAEAIKEHHPHLTLNTWPVLREVGLGPLEGQPREDVLKIYPFLKHKSILTSGIPGTEQLHEITNRCKITVDYLLSHHKNDTVAIVAHGGFISILIMYLIAKEHWPNVERPFMIGNTGVTKVTIDRQGVLKVHYVNDTSHLEDKTNTPFHDTVEK